MFGGVGKIPLGMYGLENLVILSKYPAVCAFKDFAAAAIQYLQCAVLDLYASIAMIIAILKMPKLHTTKSMHIP